MKVVYKLVLVLFLVCFSEGVFGSYINISLYPSNVITKKGEVIGIVSETSLKLLGVSLETNLVFKSYNIWTNTFYSLVPIPHTVLSNFNLVLHFSDSENFYTNVVIPIEVVIDPLLYAKRKPKVIKDVVVSNIFDVKTNKFSFYSDSVSNFVYSRYLTVFSSPFPDSVDIISEIKDGYGVNRSRGGIIFGRIHLGVDIPRCWGTKIYPTFDGVVIKTGRDRKAGKFVVIYHGYGVSSVYMHLSKILTKNWEYITTNDVLGLVGSTGRSTGSHLHLSVSIDGVYVDPVSFLKNDYSPYSIISNGIRYNFELQ